MQAEAPAPPPPPNPQALRDQIRDAVRQQVEAARAMAQDGAEGAVQVAPAPGDLTPTVVVRDFPTDMIPPQAVDISLMFFVTVFAIIVGFPIARAIARRIDRRTEQAAVPAEVSMQLNQIAQSVDAMAIEIERISEGQRFTTKLLAEQQGRRELPQGSNVRP